MVKQTMQYQKSTKNTHVYNCVSTDDANPAVPTIYIRRDVFDGKQPNQITLSIDTNESE